jgi:membrane protein YdbS with pleckstrin-like domain
MTRSVPDPINPAADTTDPGGPVVHDISAPREKDPENVYYEGSPLVRGNVGSLLLFFLLGAILIAVPIVYRYLRHDWPHWGILVGCVVIGLILFVAPTIWSRTIRYRISNYRIDFERGFLGKTIDTTELWHVDDIQFHQSFIERLLGVGTITVFAHDQTTPALPLKGLPRPREIFDALKARVIAIKRSRGVIKMDT